VDPQRTVDVDADDGLRDLRQMIRRPCRRHRLQERRQHVQRHPQPRQEGHRQV